jgi:thymidine kinase
MTNPTSIYSTHDFDKTNQTYKSNQSNQSNQTPYGYLNLIIGPMFSGKSTKLIEYIRKTKNDDNNIIVIKPSIDTRYGVSNEICTHNADKESCIMVEVDKLDSIFEIESFNSVTHVFIEEAQFFKNLYNIVETLTVKYNKKVYVAGLNGDSNREIFGEIYKLLPIADNIEFIKAICSQCNDQTAGIYSKRFSQNKSQVYVSGANEYQPVCRKHYFE